MKLAVLRAMKAVGLFALARQLTRRGVRVLCYHGTWLGGEGFPGDAMFMKAATFEARLDLIQRLGYPVVPLAQAVGMLRGETQGPDWATVITIDDGWYSTYRDMLPALRRRGLPATLYVDTRNLLSGVPVPHVMARYLKRLVGEGYAGRAAEGEAAASAERSWRDVLRFDVDPSERIAAALEFAGAHGIDGADYRDRRVFGYMTPDELATAHRDGLDVQLHSHSHDLDDYGEARMAAEIGQNRAHLAEILGGEPTARQFFCYPSGRYDRSVGPVLDRLGVRSSTTLEPRIAYRGVDLQFLPRLADGEQVSPIELEADLCGIGDLMRGVRDLVKRALRPGR